MNGLESWFPRFVSATKNSGIFGILLLIDWVLLPTAFVTVWHPEDAVGFQLWLQGFAVPHYMSAQALRAGFGAAIFIFGVLCLGQYNILQMIYRRSGTFVHFGPAAAVLIGVIANGCWWYKTGYWDLGGAMAGLSPAFVAVVAQVICERAAGNMVFGDTRPHYEEGY
jgi:hypothetical protein